MYELLDFKTSKFAPSQAFLDVDYQFGLYALACADATFKSSDGTLRLLDIPPDRLKITWYHLRDHIPYKRKTKNNQIGDERGDPRRTTARSEEQIKSLKQDLSKVATNIRRGVFPRNPSYHTCPLCPYAEMCAKDSCGMGLNRNQKSQIQQLVQNLEEAA
ncbi:PD-(D/E)XK nuclease family protein [bacterium]|nr:PD-(D/E)XK nuclease family protein [bacterium]